jgi:predicted Zn-dependent peptidase
MKTDSFHQSETMFVPSRQETTLKLKSRVQLPTDSQTPISVFKLDNGLTVIHQHLPATPVAVVDVWVRAGAIAEPEDWSGMAHFLEHMIFKGTAKLAPGVFDWTIENQGGVTNAATSYDYAHFFITTAAQNLENSLPALAELLLNAAIPEAEFVRERDVVLEEIRRANDNPDWQAYQTLLESIYSHHPYGRPILGTQAKLMQRSPVEMRAFHHAHYQPENMTVVIVGGVDSEKALELVSRHFDNFPKQLTDLPEVRIAAAPPLTEIRRSSLDLPRLEQARLMMAWVGPGIEQLQDAYGLDLISVLLAEGRTSRLVTDLREQRGLVQGISSSFSLQRESSLLTIIAWLEPQYLETVETLICDHLTTLRTTPISELELARCKRLLCNDYAFTMEVPNQLAGLYGYYSTLAQADMAVTYPAIIQKLTAADLQNLACQYLGPDHYAVTTVKPT